MKSRIKELWLVQAWFFCQPKWYNSPRKCTPVKAKTDDQFLEVWFFIYIYIWLRTWIVQTQKERLTLSFYKHKGWKTNEKLLCKNQTKERLLQFWLIWPTSIKWKNSETYLEPSDGEGLITRRSHGDYIFMMKRGSMQWKEISYWILFLDTIIISYQSLSLIQQFLALCQRCLNSKFFLVCILNWIQSKYPYSV